MDAWLQKAIITRSDAVMESQRQQIESLLKKNGDLQLEINQMRQQRSSPDTALINEAVALRSENVKLKAALEQAEGKLETIGPLGEVGKLKAQLHELQWKLRETQVRLLK